MALGLQRLEGERHIVGGERRAVGELRLGPQREGHRHAVRRDLCALRHEPIDGVRLVRRAGHQRVEQKLEPLRRVALENVVVEAVEGGHPAPADEREGAALRRVGVRVGEVLEVCGIREIAEGREPVLCFGTRRRGCGKRESGAGDGGGAKSADQPRPQGFGAPGSLAASSLSNHHTCGKPGVSAGKVDGWPKRSQ